MYNDEQSMWSNPELVKLNEGKFCIRECAREFIPTEDNKIKVYCPKCDRVLRLMKKKPFKDID